MDALKKVIEKKNPFKARTTVKEESLPTGTDLKGERMDSSYQNLEKNNESRSDYRKLNIKRRRQKVSKKPLHAASSQGKSLKPWNATLIEKKDNLDHYDVAIEKKEKIEKSGDVRKRIDLFQSSKQEEYFSPKVEMETVQRKDDKVFFNLFPGTIEDTQVVANPYFSYIVMLSPIV